MNTLKAYLSVQASFVSAFVISKTVISHQKPRGRQLLVNKSHSQHSVAAVCSEGRYFVILYTSAQVVSFPDQILQSLVWERD